MFVGNPSKPQPIIDILSNNREKLLKYLEDFHTDRGEQRGRQLIGAGDVVVVRESSPLRLHAVVVLAVWRVPCMEVVIGNLRVVAGCLEGCCGCS